MLKRFLTKFQAVRITPRQAVFGGLAALAFGLVVHGLLASPEQPPTQPAPPVLEPVSEQHAVEAKPDSPSPDSLWQTAVQRLEQADQESAKAMESRLADVATFFSERKKGAAAFAEEMTGTEAKIEVARSIAWLPVGGLIELFGGDDSGPIRIERFATTSFQRHVLEPGQVRAAVDQAVAAYAGDVREIDGRLLVDLRLDLGDDAMATVLNAPSLSDGLVVDPDFRGLVNRAVDTACLDSLYAIGGFVASMWASDKLTDAVVGESGHPLAKFGANVAIGTQIDNGLAAAMHGAGYDPKAEIVGRVSKSLAAIEAEIVEGGSGLRQALRAMHDRLAVARREAVRRAIYGADAPSDDRPTVTATIILPPSPE